MEEIAADDPRTLGRYRVVSRLGNGGLGRVLLGVDDAGRRVALKVVHPQLAALPGFRERFRREVQLAATAPPWFTAALLDADPDGDPPWVATAYVEAPSLQAYVSANGPLGRAGTLALAVRMADGLVAMHGAGLVHRDLKPSNVLLAEDGPCLIDGGFSRTVDPMLAAQAGHVVATPEYMTPEEIAGLDVGPAGDVFCLGSLIGYAATGRSPFAADSVPGVLHRVAQAEPDLGPLDGPLRDAVVACLAKDPAARPTAARLRDLLRPLENPDAAAPAPAPTAATAAMAAPGRPSTRPSTCLGTCPCPAGACPAGACPGDARPAGAHPGGASAAGACPGTARPGRSRRRHDGPRHGAARPAASGRRLGWRSRRGQPGG
ncbi:serine/threonine-protein kinase [Pseudonocardia xinjiangensis]|uniref:serine/threonine-protein kinase n=1 Tax=Pseudonocardia xinjiangensis TaxID=75289 RepID=UPI003D909CE4